MLRSLTCALVCALSCAVHAADLKAWTGGPPPPLALKDLDGRVHRLADYRGRVILVNFWATWCAPCRDEMPSIQQLKQKLSGRPFTVLAVNLDEPEARIRSFLAGVKVDFAILLDPEGKATREWGARVLPASFVVGPEGRIRYSLIGELDWGHDLVVSRIVELLPTAHRSIPRP
jgi:thiol-disulfide isomerase/thioredoxin